MMNTDLRVSNPPTTPVMIWDGECHFCRRWIERWRSITHDAIDYTTYQESAGRFAEITREECERSVIYVDSDGNVFSGANAVFRAFQCRSSRKWLAWSYDHVPGFAPITEAVYRFIAHHRKFASAVTRLLWGEDVRVPTYFTARRWFLRSLGLIYLIAFVSLWVQVDGLIGSNGITPVGEFLQAARGQLGPHATSILPTLCWLNSSDLFLHLLCAGGAVLSLLLIFEIAPAVSLFGLFVFYLSLTIAGQTFLSFQWDILLIETGFLSIFLAPWQLWPKRGSEQPVSGVALFLLRLLLFKLMVMSGVVKLTSGDDSWWNLTALDYHYWSQPLPTIFAWFAAKGPDWIRHFSVAFCLVIEIIVPILFWAPRRLCLLACGSLVFLQIAIAVTGNYCFFNLLTIALCLLLIDDSVWPRREVFQRTINEQSFPTNRLSIYGAGVVLVLTLPFNAWLVCSAFYPEADVPRFLLPVYTRLEAFRIVNGYGLFRVMTKDRREIVIEGSVDGIDWQPYGFKWKPGDVMRPPGWCAPHQPRLDWQMWFAALGSYQQNPWFVRLVICLLHGKPEVTQLLARNPFPEAPPRYVRAIFYRYRFTSSDEHRQTGAWWKREELSEYLPSVSLQDVRQD